MRIHHKDFAHLAQEDRFRIETLFNEKRGVREIARIAEKWGNGNGDRKWGQPPFFNLIHK